jgi:hypothetical protein
MSKITMRHQDGRLAFSVSGFVTPIKIAASYSVTFLCLRSRATEITFPYPRYKIASRIAKSPGRGWGQSGQ